MDLKTAELPRLVAVIWLFCFTIPCDNIYRFGPVQLGPADLRRAHGTERISVKDCGQGVQFYIQLIRNSAQ